MDDATNHDVENQEDINKDELQDENIDEGVDTPENTEEENSEDDSKKGKDGAEQAKETQKRVWLERLKEGKITIDEMPENLGWLKKDPEFDKFREQPKKPKKEDFYSAVDRVLDERDAKKEFNSMIDDLQRMDISAEKDAELRGEFEDLLSNFSNPTPSQTLKALKTACRLVGIQDVSKYAKDRRRKGMTLPPLGGKKRDTSINAKAKDTEIEKRLGGNLPPGFKA